jgi:hypothetical protein
MMPFQICSEQSCANLQFKFRLFTCSVSQQKAKSVKGIALNAGLYLRNAETPQKVGELLRIKRLRIQATPDF